MQPLRYSAALTAFFAMFIIPTIASAQAPLGSWQLDPARSMQNPAPEGPAPQSPTVRSFQNWGDGLVFVRNDGVDGEGNPTGNRIIFRRDGRRYPIAARNQPGYVSIAFVVTSQRPYSANYTVRLDGEVVTTATETISADGQTMIAMTKGANGSTAKQVWGEAVARAAHRLPRQQRTGDLPGDFRTN